MIYIDEIRNIFVLTTKNIEYAFCVDNIGLLRNLYWGEKIDSIKDYEIEELVEVSTNDPVFEITKEEYPVYGGLRYKENCLKVTFSNNTRDIVYKYLGYEKSDDELIVKLKDKHYDLQINLVYKLYYEFDLIERKAIIINNSKEDILLENVMSAQLHIPYENLTFRNTHGYWAAEQQEFIQNVSYGKIVIENRRGVSGHNHNPYFILDNNATETTGEVYFGALKLTGNFKGIIEQTQYG